MQNQVKNPSDIDLQAMESLLQEWRNQNISADKFELEHPEIVAQTFLERIWAWEDFAIFNFVRKAQNLLAPQQVTA